MSPLVRGELHVGLVLFLCPFTLRKHALSVTQDVYDRPITPHAFLCLSVDDDGTSAWTPVTSKYREGRVMLEDGERVGHHWWTSEKKHSYIVPSAKWVAGLDGLNEAMRNGGDMSKRMHRNHYRIKQESIDHILNAPQYE